PEAAARGGTIRLARARVRSARGRQAVGHLRLARRPRHRDRVAQAEAVAFSEMRRYLMLQLGQFVLVSFGISVTVFALIRLTGDPVSAMLPLDATAEQALDLRRRMGLDDPLPVQYWLWLSAALHGDFGRAFFQG